jgi:hypothetical protein
MPLPDACALHGHPNQTECSTPASMAAAAGLKLLPAHLERIRAGNYSALNLAERLTFPALAAVTVSMTLPLFGPSAALIL